MSPAFLQQQFCNIDVLLSLIAHSTLLQDLIPRVGTALLGLELRLWWTSRSGCHFAESKQIPFAAGCRFWAVLPLSLGPILELKSITNHVPVWQINLAVTMPVTGCISHALGCLLKKDCLSRRLVGLDHSCIHHQTTPGVNAHPKARALQGNCVMCRGCSSAHHGNLPNSGPVAQWCKSAWSKERWVLPF